MFWFEFGKNRFRVLDTRSGHGGYRHFIKKHFFGYNGPHFRYFQRKL